LPLTQFHVSILTVGRRVFITVAEVSGDKHAAQLIRSLRQLDPEMIIEGLGGPEMAAAGARIHAETVSGAAMGVRGALRVVDVWKWRKWLRNHFDNHRPDLLIGVDSPSMNFHFARAAHDRGIPVLQYVAPQLWAWQEWRIKKVRRWIDRLACILPFEEEYFRRRGVRATFVGHPLFDQLPANHGDHDGRRDPSSAPIVGLLAGSRKSEADANFPHQLDVAERIQTQFPQARFLIPTTSATEPVVARVLQERGAGSAFEHAVDQFDQMVPRCDLCLTVSGTATLHVAGHGVPMIVVYRGNPLLWHTVGRLMVRTRTFSLVNLLSDFHEHIVPEFVPWYGSNEPVAQAAIDLLGHPQKLESQRQRLRHLIQSLDKPGASMNVAKLAMEMMETGKSETAEIPAGS
jgi:lipid-A-disaccharide synthase